MHAPCYLRGVRWLAILALIGIPIVRPAAPASAAPTAEQNSPPQPAFGRLPLSFEPNAGQTDASVDFVTRIGRYSVDLSRGDASFHLNHAASPSSDSPAVSVQLLGASAHPLSSAEDQLPGTANYLLSEDQSQWHTAIPTYARVRYRDVYPGIDLVYYGAHGALEDDFVVAPAADPALIQLAIHGATAVELDPTGTLLIRTGQDEMRLEAPVAYQQDAAGARSYVSVSYALDERAGVQFELGAYDAGRALVIDPVLAYSTFIGGIQGASIAVDSQGSAYIAAVGCGCAIKLNPAGTALVYTALLGMSAPGSIAVDQAGNAYVVGGDTVAKLNSSGTALLYSQTLTSAGAQSVAVDGSGAAYVTGVASPGFITTPGAFQRTFKAGRFHAFAVKLDPAGSVVYSTLFGGSALVDSGNGVAVDSIGNAYVTGGTESADLPTTPGAFQRTLRGPTDAFVAKFNATGTDLIYSTYIGGSLAENPDGIAVNSAGQAYISGASLSSDFPTTPGAFQRTQRASGPDKFVTRLNSTGTGLVYSTYVGGSNLESPSLGSPGLAIDASGSAYVTAESESPDLPTTPGAFQPNYGGNVDAFVIKLDPSGSVEAYGSFLGGSGFDAGYAIAVDSAGAAYVTGRSESSDFPTTRGALQGPGSSTAFLSKIVPGPPACQIVGLLPGPPAQLQVAVHADRGLASLSVTQASNTTVAVSTFATGTLATVRVTATKIDQTARATFTLRATDRTGVSLDCDPALLTIGNATGDRRVQVLHHVAKAESHVTITNGDPGLERVRLIVNGHSFAVAGLVAGETRTLDVASAMRHGADNTIFVIALGPRGSSAVVMISDS